MLAAMVPRLIALVAGSLICSLVVMPMVGDPSWLTWLALLALTGIGIPLSAWASVRLLWPAKSGAAAWTAVIAALVVQLGLSVGVWMEHALTPHDIGSAVGRLFRGEGMAPGGLSSTRLGSKLAFAWVKPMGGEGGDEVHRMVAGADGLYWLAGARKVQAGSADGELLFLGMDADGNIQREHAIARVGQAKVVALDVDEGGTLTAVVTGERRVHLSEGGRLLKGTAGMATVVLQIGTDGAVGEVLGLPFTAEAWAADGRVVVAGYNARALSWGDVTIKDRGLAVLDVSGAKAGQYQVMLADPVTASSVTLTSDALWVSVALGLTDKLTAGAEVYDVDDAPYTVLVTLDPETLSVNTSFKLGELDVQPELTLPAGDGELIVGMTIPRHRKVAEAPVTFIDARLQPLGPLTVVLGQLSTTGELRWTSTMGNPTETSGVHDAVKAPGVVVRDEHGLFAILHPHHGVVAGALTSAAPLKSDGKTDGVAIRLSHTGQAAFIDRQGSVEGHEAYRAAVVTPKGLLIGGTSALAGELGGFALPEDPSKAPMMTQAFVGLARVK